MSKFRPLILLVMVALVGLSLAAFSGDVSAQSGSGEMIMVKVADATSASPIDSNAYGYEVGNKGSDNITAPKAWILRWRGVPGKGIDKAPGLQKPFNYRWQHQQINQGEDNRNAQNWQHQWQVNENAGKKNGKP